MKIITYNVNGLRAAVTKGLPEWLANEQPDVLCLQETKLQPEQYPAEALDALGYRHYLHSARKKGYSGVAILTKREPDHVEYGMGMEEFKDYWLNVHGPIASKMANLRKYDQHVVVDAEHRHAIGQGSVVIDGYSELQFDSYGDMVEGVESLHGEGANDVPMFANPHCQILVLAKREVIRIPEYLRGRKLIKRVSFLGRADGVTSEQFVKEWWNVHDRLVQTVPGCVGYNQDLVIDRIDGGVSVPYEELPVEGVVEMWFETKEAFDEYYASPEFARASAHSSEFIGAINTYLTETYPVALPSA